MNRSRAQLLFERIPDKWTYQHEQLNGHFGKIVKLDSDCAVIRFFKLERIAYVELDFDLRFLNPVLSLIERARRPTLSQITRSLAIRLARRVFLELDFEINQRRFEII
jgi:hypothetical protein